jgi:hypothetical protein
MSFQVRRAVQRHVGLSQRSAEHAAPGRGVLVLQRHVPLQCVLPRGNLKELATNKEMVK